jgi:hypothetical protein
MAGGTYLNFDLRIERSVRGGADGSPGYRAELIASPSGEASAEFSLALPQDASPELLGRQLFEGAFSGEVLTALRRSQDKVARRNGGLRIRLRLADAPELADLPWEALYDASRDRFLALSSDTPLVRYLDLPEPIQPLRVKPPLPGGGAGGAATGARRAGRRRPDRPDRRGAAHSGRAAHSAASR